MEINKHGHGLQICDIGAAYVGWGNYRFGIDSDRYIRYPIQVIGAHYYISQQPGQEVLSNAINPYFQ